MFELKLPTLIAEKLEQIKATEIAKKINQAKIDWAEYRLQQLPNGKYSYSFRSIVTDDWLTSTMEDCLDSVLAQLEHGTRGKADRLKMENIQRIDIRGGKNE